MALSLRASLAVHLAHSDTMWLLDWDESDAFLRVCRSTLPDILEGTSCWNFSEWSKHYYSRLRIWPVTPEGLAPPFNTSEGFNQDDSASGAAFQVVNAVRTSCIRSDEALEIPSPLGPIDPHLFTFSDD